MTAVVAAVDIGGANIKVYGPRAGAGTRPFALWLRPGDLARELIAALRPQAPFEALAVTMTGELCDGFVTKAEGVRSILAAAGAAARALGAREALVWRRDGLLVALDEALEDPAPAAAANWLALASFAGRLAPAGFALLADTGSTTTDLVLLADGKPRPTGFTDTERLQSGELVYTGVRRTPLCAIAGAVPYRGRTSPVAAELFATAIDVYLTLGEVPEEPGARDTADGRPATRTWARDRLARMVGADRETFSDDDARAAADFVAAAQRRAIALAARRVAAGRDLAALIVSGSGEFLARAATAGLAPRTVSLAREFGPEVSTAAPAYALQRIAEERLAARS